MKEDTTRIQPGNPSFHSVFLDSLESADLEHECCAVCQFSFFQSLLCVSIFDHVNQIDLEEQSNLQESINGSFHHRSMIVSTTGKPPTQRTPEEVLAERQRYEKQNAQLNESEMISRSRPEDFEAVLEEDEEEPDTKAPNGSLSSERKNRTLQSQVSEPKTPGKTAVPPGYDPDLIRKNMEMINSAQAALLETQTVRAEEVSLVLNPTF